MDIGILNIGDELLAGKILNSNQHDISRLVTPLGHRVLYGMVIGDDIAAIGSALDGALGAPPGRSGAPVAAASWPPVDVLLLTGGLGPTRDDLTREAVARWLGSTVVESAEALAWLSDFFRKPVAELAPGQRPQAMVPAGTEPLRNPAGTACGFRFRAGRTLVMAFPGVPQELQAMAAEHLLPGLAGDNVLLEKGLWTWGWSEGLQRDALAGVAFPAGMRFSSLPGERGVRISLQLLVPHGEAARRQGEFDKAWQALLSAIPPECLVDADGLALPAAVISMLKSRSARLSVAESCTGGGLAHLLTETAGSSSVFDRGFVTYSNQAKTDLLGVPEATLEAHGAVSEATAVAMATGCLERSGATYACAITGIAGPEGGTPEKPVGTVWIAVAGGNPVSALARRYQFRGDRQAVRLRSAYSALNQIRLFIADGAK